MCARCSSWTFVSSPWFWSGGMWFQLFTRDKALSWVSKKHWRNREMYRYVYHNESALLILINNVSTSHHTSKCLDSTQLSPFLRTQWIYDVIWFKPLLFVLYCVLLPICKGYSQTLIRVSWGSFLSRYQIMQIILFRFTGYTDCL